MDPVRWFVDKVTKFGLEIMCRIDGEELKMVPNHGPLIAYTNHIGSVEVPLIYTQLLPRKMTGLAKIEHWDSPFYRWIFTLWGAIPLKRDEADIEAMNKSLGALAQGYILGLAPEGTRSRTGTLDRAHPGIVTLGLHSNAPLLPIAHWGGENLRANLKRFRRTDFHVRVGRVIRLDSQGEKVTKANRQQMADELMYQLARLLPEKYRGGYTDLDNASEKYIKFD
jgi:1-acyl-sn-glycerol-3-phosphate acyltransferase